MKGTYILITNLSYVTIRNATNSVRTMTHALLLEEDDLFGALRTRIRGFGPDPAWPVFNMETPSIEYTLTDPYSVGRIFSDADSAPKPLMRIGVLQITNGPELVLTTEDTRHPFHIDRFSCNSRGSFADTMALMWGTLSARTAEYWIARGGCIPRLVWEPPVPCKEDAEEIR